MKTSESIKNIAPALLEAQNEITFAVKDAINPHFKNRYADLSAVIDAVKPALNKAKIVFLQSPSPSDDGKLHLTTRLIHASGEWIEDTAVCPLPKADPQGFGSAMTYLRRYSLASIIGLYQDDDDGESARPTYKKEDLDNAIKILSNIDQLDILKDTFFSYQKQFGMYPDALKQIINAKDKRKTELESA